jgi:hypothetical protein
MGNYIIGGLSVKIVVPADTAFTANLYLPGFSPNDGLIVQRIT